MPAWLRVQLMRELEATALKAAPSVQGLAPESRDRVWVSRRMGSALSDV